MDTNVKTIWQQAAGDVDRNYSDICLKWDVILNGPGYAGPWPECIKKLVDDEISSRKITDIKRFCEEVKDGDIMILRIGTSTVLAVGQVVGEYEWNDAFGDIDGWDIQHVRRVRWLWKNTENPMQFDAYDMKFGDTTQKLNPGRVMDWVKNMEISAAEFNRSLAELPYSDNSSTSIEEVSEYLFDRGVSSSSITTLTDEIGELVRIAKWYQRSTNKPSEHETIAYLVAPLLRGLGWTPQRMAIEWNYVDLALFTNLPREDTNLTVVVEAKRMGTSCLTARSQAEDYGLLRPNCRRLVVTDGLRYSIYIKGIDDKYLLYAYLNLAELRNDYSVYPCKGAKEALLALAQEWKIET